MSACPTSAGPRRPPRSWERRRTCRVWEASPDAWRVDVLRATGELDTYGDATGIWTWDSDRRLAQRSEGLDELRLPRPSDFVPPELGRRFVTSAAPAQLHEIGRVRVAGRSVPGLRIVVTDPVTTIDHIDVWADARSGLPVRVDVSVRGSSRPAFRSEFLDLSLAAPSATDVAFRIPRTARVDRDDDGLDLVQAVERFSPVSLPARLAGLARTSQRSTGVATYGAPWSLVTVLAVPGRNLARLLPDTVAPTKRPWGATATVIESSLVNAMAMQIGPVGYVLAGTVPLDQLDRVGEALARANGGSVA